MIRTQVQLPDELHREARRLAEEQESTLADVIRRGLEYMVRIYPRRADAGARWHPPAPRRLGSIRAPVEQWREIANEGPPAP
ncbi:antitoxin [Actinobacteria bacterium YIM 96077]|uniref:Antitoxin n=1 Tax=Phytoactinopolyspora halophila TaxID=1981511 RepID=A0A329QAY6_9ACTN|nr:antitoxin [Phytoactinopolyspora halophila]AYY13075.1 antitoxin [Actinobacteria bacterium YIM 96077]RAW09231.1 antitoxin [Phytoactinopolyspora halophila]